MPPLFVVQISKKERKKENKINPGLQPILPLFNIAAYFWTEKFSLAWNVGLRTSRYVPKTIQQHNFKHVSNRNKKCIKNTITMDLNVFKNLKICLWNLKRDILERACLPVFKSFYKTINSISVDQRLEWTESSLRMYVSHTSLVSLREDKGDKATQRKKVVMGCPTTCQE